MILDEPFRGLDAMTTKLMQEYYESLYEETRGTALFVTTNIDEAIYLADRIVVMTNKPTQVRAVLDVPLPRPRHLADVVESEAANAVKRTALALLHEEAMRSFTGGKAASDFVKAYGERLGKEEPAEVPVQPTVDALQSGERHETR
jgi:NitT/TauT family transport system ATP-binding protein